MSRWASLVTRGSTSTANFRLGQRIQSGGQSRPPGVRVASAKSSRWACRRPGETARPCVAGAGARPANRIRAAGVAGTARPLPCGWWRRNWQPQKVQRRSQKGQMSVDGLGGRRRTRRPLVPGCAQVVGLLEVLTEFDRGWVGRVARARHCRSGPAIRPRWSEESLMPRPRGKSDSPGRARCAK